MRVLKKIFAKGTNLLWIGMLILASCSSGESKKGLEVKVENLVQSELKEQYIVLDNPQFIQKLLTLELDKLRVISGEAEIPYQVMDKNADGKPEKLVILVDLAPNEEKELQFREGGTAYKGTKKTQAELSIREGGNWVEVTKSSGVQQYEYQGGKFKNTTFLRVPDQHTDHSFYIRYEGPGWESDKIGYRFYLDWRNAVDIFGKRTSEMVLQHVGQDGFESYHNLSYWGMDVLKVGNSLGMGSIGFWDKKNAVRIAVTDSVFCKIVDNGDLYSSINTVYYGWKDAGRSVDLSSTISIFAGSRISWESIELSEMLDNLCTGIVKDEKAELILSEDSDSEWSYLATFGKQSLNGDNLGMFVFYKKEDFISLKEDLYSHVVVLNPSAKNITYGFGAVWEKDLEHIATKEEFIDFLKKTREELNNPPKVIY
jgi:hypothetical protein